MTWPLQQLPQRCTLMHCVGVGCAQGPPWRKAGTFPTACTCLLGPFCSPGMIRVYSGALQALWDLPCRPHTH